MLALLRNVETLTLRARSSDLRLTSTAFWTHFAPLSAPVNQHDRFHRTTFNIPSGIATVKVFPPTQAVQFHSSRPNRDIQDEFMKHLKLMLSTVDWKEAKDSPKAALAYGAGGLLPFLFPPIAILLNGAYLPNLAFAQVAYGAIILSFLGGIKWGFAVPDNTSQKLNWENLGVSVAMSLVGWSSLLFPPFIGSLTLMGGLGASAYIDIMSPGYPRWFKALRLCLTSVAIGSLATTVVLRILL